MTIDHEGAHVDFDKLYNVIIMMASVYILSSLFTYLQGVTAAKLSQYTVSTMRATCSGRFRICRYATPTLTGTATS